MSAAFDTSQLIAETLRPGAPAWILALASASAPWSRARIATSAPDLAYSSAIARPSPLLPPVTTALRPFSLMSIPGLRPKIATAISCHLIDLPYVPFCQSPAARGLTAALFRLGRVGGDSARLRAPRQPAATPRMKAASLHSQRPEEYQPVHSRQPCWRCEYSGEIGSIPQN